MKAYGIPAARIPIVGAGFREGVFKPDAACARPSDREELTIVYAGKISAPKEVPWLIESIGRSSQASTRPQPGMRPGCRPKRLSWSGVFEKVQAGYRELAEF